MSGKGLISMTHYNLVHKFIPMPRAMKIPDAKAAVDKDWKELEPNPSMEFGKSQEKKKISLESQRDKITSTLLHWWTQFTSKMRSWNQKYWSTKAESCPVRHCKRRLWSQCCFYWIGLVCVSQSLPQKVLDVVARLPGCDGQAGYAVSADTWCKIGGCSHVVKIPKSECLDVWARLPRHTRPKSWAKTKIPWYFLNEICTDTRKGADHNGSRVEEIDQTCRSWRIYIISWPWKLVMYPAWMQTEWNNCWTIHEDVWVTWFCWSNRKITRMAESRTKLERCPTTWKDMLKHALIDVVNW